MQLSEYGVTDANIWPGSFGNDWDGPSKCVIWFTDPKYNL